MQTLKTLIDESLKVCNGNQSELARRLQCRPSHVSMIVNGQRSLTWNHAAILADITGTDAHEAIHAALMAETPMHKNGQKLREILGKGLVHGVAALLVFSYSAEQNNATEKIATSVNPLYIVFTGLMSLIVARLGVFLLRKNRALAYGRASHKIAAAR